MYLRLALALRLALRLTSHNTITQHNISIIQNATYVYNMIWQYIVIIILQYSNWKKNQDILRSQQAPMSIQTNSSKVKQLGDQCPTSSLLSNNSNNNSSSILAITGAPNMKASLKTSANININIVGSTNVNANANANNNNNNPMTNPNPTTKATTSHNTKNSTNNNNNNNNNNDDKDHEKDKLVKMRNRLKQKQHELQSVFHDIDTQYQEQQRINTLAKKQQLHNILAGNQKKVDIININSNKNINNNNNNNSNFGHDSLNNAQSNTNNINNNQSCSNEDMIYCSYRSRPQSSPYSLLQKQLHVHVLSTAVFYPPTCSAYSATHCKHNDTVYLYGGISCTSQLQDGLKQQFYRLDPQANQWEQIKPVSVYQPMPRYGHTLTATPDSLLLFGGVSQFKQKLKDRCFYPDVWRYSIPKNNWKVLQFTGPTIKPRKSHASCLYLNKYYIVLGGIDDNEEVINEIAWVNVEERKSRWRSRAVQGRFNHEVVVYMSNSSNNRDYLCVFGGRNNESQIIGELIWYQLSVVDGELVIKDPQRVIINSSNEADSRTSTNTNTNTNTNNCSTLRNSMKKMNSIKSSSAQQQQQKEHGQALSLANSTQTTYPTYTMPYHTHSTHTKHKHETAQMLTACQFPIMCSLDSGILIMGGIGTDSQAVEQCWYYHIERGIIQRITSQAIVLTNANHHNTIANENNNSNTKTSIKSNQRMNRTNNNNKTVISLDKNSASSNSNSKDSNNNNNASSSSSNSNNININGNSNSCCNNNGLDWQQLRSAKAVSINNNKAVYMLAGCNSKKYKAMKLTLKLGTQHQDDTITKMFGLFR